MRRPAIYEVAAIAAPVTRPLNGSETDIFLVDKLDIVEWGNPRTRVASLQHGETAYIDGVVAEGWHERAEARLDLPGADPYRGAARPPPGLIMTSPRERMLVSTEPPGRRHGRRASAHLSMAIAFAISFVGANILIFGWANIVNVFGDVIETDAVASYDEDRHCRLHATYIDYATNRKIAVDDYVGGSTCVAARRGDLQRIPFRVVRRWPFFNAVGTGATLGLLHMLLAGALFFGLILYAMTKISGAREWFDQKRIVEAGRGRLKT